MKKIFEIMLPTKADNTLRGSKWTLYLFILVAVIGTVRSCIHIFSPDGGAGSIAGMEMAVTGANEVIFAFALWGAEQLVYVLIQWAVILRYRSLVPLMWGGSDSGDAGAHASGSDQAGQLCVYPARRIPELHLPGAGSADVGAIVVERTKSHPRIKMVDIAAWEKP